MIRRLIDRARHLLRSGSFFRSVTVLASGTVLAQGAYLLVSPLISRIYAPDALGEFGLFLSVLSIASIAATGRYDTAIVSGADRQEAGHLLVGALAFCAVLMVPMGVGYWALIASGRWGFDSLPVYSVAILLGGVFLMSAFSVLRYWCIREAAFGVISRVTVARGVARGGLQVLAGLVSSTWLGLAAGEIGSRFVGLSTMYLPTRARLREIWARFDPGELRSTLIAYYKYPVLALPSSLINAAAINLAVPAVFALYGATSAGFFALVQRVLSAPVALIGDSVADAFHSKAADLVRDNPERLRGVFYRTALFLGVASLAGVAILLFLAPPLFGLVFGAEWRPSGRIAAAMAPWFAAQLTVSPLSRIVYVLDGQAFKLIYDLLALSVIAGFFLYFSAHIIPVRQFVLYLSIANMIIYGVYFAILAMVVEKGHVRYGIDDA